MVPNRLFPRGPSGGGTSTAGLGTLNIWRRSGLLSLALRQRLQVEEDHLTVSSVPVAGRGPIETVVCLGYAIAYNAAAVAKQDPILRALGMASSCSHNDE